MEAGNDSVPVATLPEEPTSKVEIKPGGLTSQEPTIQIEGVSKVAVLDTAIPETNDRGEQCKL